MRVVYISNPMKVQTSPKDFRALVQELTGQDSELPSDPKRFEDRDSYDGGDGGRGGRGGGGDGGHQTDSDNSVTKIGNENENMVVMQPEVDPNSGIEGQFEPFDEVLTPQMIENISALLPASVLYESAQVDQIRFKC